MRVALALNGSRGDIQPGLAVARELAARGHDVAVGVPENLLEFTLASTAGHDVDASVFAPDTAALLRSPLVQRDLKSRNPRTRSRAIREVTEFGASTMDDRLLDLSDGADLVVTGLMGQERAATVAEYRGCAYIPLHYCPIRPSRSVPIPLGPLARLAAVPPLNAAVWGLIDTVFWLSSAKRSDSALRARLGMAQASGPLGDRLRRADVPEIQAYDPALFPGLAREWGEHRPLTGFLGLVPESGSGDSRTPGAGPEGTGSDTETLDWIDAGPPPVHVGFGSMPLADPVAAVGGLVAALRDRGARVLLGAGPNLDALTALSDTDVRVVHSTEHSTVLPRCAAIVHHGGAGTTGAGLRAGLPTMIAAFSADQPMWGRAIVDSGLGSTCAVGDLTDPGSVSDAVARILEPEIAHRCATFSETMIDPATAVASAVDILETAK